MTNELLSAIEKMSTANKIYRVACIAKFGRYVDDEELYFKHVSLQWREYLQAGGSLTMINR